MFVMQIFIWRRWKTIKSSGNIYLLSAAARNLETEDLKVFAEKSQGHCEEVSVRYLCVVTMVTGPKCLTVKARL